MSIFSILSYREVLKNRVEDKKKVDSKMNFSSLAREIRVQSPYLSKVMNGTADLSADQLYLACEFLSFSEEERVYLELLLEFERSSLVDRKNVLEKKILRMQEEYLDTTSHIKTQELDTNVNTVTEYYLDPLNLVVHMCLSIEKFQENIDLLVESVGFPKKRVLDVLSNLQRMSIVEFVDGQYRNKLKYVHLPSKSQLCGPHQTLLRQMVINHFQNNTNDKAYNLMITYSGDDKSRKKIKDMFLNFLSDVDKVIDKAPSEHVYQLNFDLFPWSNEVS